MRIETDTDAGTEQTTEWHFERGCLVPAASSAQLEEGYFRRPAHQSMLLAWKLFVVGCFDHKKIYYKSSRLDEKIR